MTVETEPGAQAYVDDFSENGFVRVPKVFSPTEVAELRAELDWLISEWAERMAWTGGWRAEYLEPSVEKDAKFDGMHDLELYSGAWARAAVNPKLAEVLGALLGTVEFHHTTMHVKPPQTGMPFPMHQDYPFYQHADGRYVDVLLHLDDTCHENGEIRFLPGSHKRGALDHITVMDGRFCTPFLPTDRYRLENTVAVPAKAGDIVCFSIHTIHGSHINSTSQPRRLVRMGYRHPENVQLLGQSIGRRGVMLWGHRERPGSRPPSVD